MSDEPTILHKKVFGELSLIMMFRAYRALRSIKDGKDVIAVTVLHWVVITQAPVIPRRTLEEVQALMEEVRGTQDEKWRLDKDENGKQDEHGRTDHDALLSFSYFMLQQKELTRGEVAEFAAAMLQKPIEQEQWRKRVDRWVERQKYPPIKGTKRRSKGE